MKAPQLAALRAGPWLWPSEGTPQFLRALQKVPEGRPLAAPGQVLLVAAKTDAAMLAAVSIPGDVILFGRTSKNAAQTARVAASRCLPILAASVPELADGCVPLANISLIDNTAAPDPAAYDGPSFGLAFFLSAASKAFKLPLPDDVVATAKIDGYGRLSDVGHLPQKLYVLAKRAPRIQRVLVAPGQDTTGIDPRYASLLVTVPSATAALREVFGEGLEEALFPAQATDGTIARVVGDYFRLALKERNDVAVDWAPEPPSRLQCLWTTVSTPSPAAFVTGASLTQRRRPRPMPAAQDRSVALALWLNRSVPNFERYSSFKITNKNIPDSSIGYFVFNQLYRSTESG